MKNVESQTSEMDERSFEVSLMTPDVIDHYWPGVEELLDADPELWNKAYTKADILERIRDTRIQVWAVFNGRVIRLIFFTQRYVSPNGVATLQIFWMFGNGVRDMLKLLDDVIDSFAAKLQCSRLEVTGRKGWERVLAPLGAEFQYSVWSRPVRNRSMRQ